MTYFEAVNQKVRKSSVWSGMGGCAKSVPAHKYIQNRCWAQAISFGADGWKDRSMGRQIDPRSMDRYKIDTWSVTTADTYN